MVCCNIDLTVELSRDVPPQQLSILRWSTKKYSSLKMFGVCGFIFIPPFLSCRGADLPVPRKSYIHSGLSLDLLQGEGVPDRRSSASPPPFPLLASEHLPPGGLKFRSSGLCNLVKAERSSEKSSAVQSHLILGYSPPSPAARL